MNNVSEARGLRVEALGHPTWGHNRGLKAWGERQGRMGPAVMGLDTQPPLLQVHHTADVHTDGLERCLGFGIYNKWENLISR